ncbi:phosphatidylinositol 3-kinase 2-like [Stegodyphus dumicola]|uniref:phosphatidylinositol 3-kinase 2-like n=1 Tax=Stegodyphus dumicola TaxID=202533 RepID=UPI0015A87E38|nr:phosphatidylinositol 3-kinase 2-like [Stegodyphus dumicola]
MIMMRLNIGLLSIFYVVTISAGVKAVFLNKYEQFIRDWDLDNFYEKEEFDTDEFERLWNENFADEEYIDQNDEKSPKENITTISYTPESNAILSATQPSTNVTVLKQEELFTNNNTNANSNSPPIGNDSKTIDASTDMSFVSTPVMLDDTDSKIQQKQSTYFSRNIYTRNTTASTEVPSLAPTSVPTNSSEKILYTATYRSYVYITLPSMKAANIQNESEIVSTASSVPEDKSTESPTVLTETNLQVTSMDEMRKAVPSQTTYLQSSLLVPKFSIYPTIKTIKLDDSTTAPLVGTTADINTETISSGEMRKNISITLVVAIVFLSTGLTVTVFIAYIFRVKCKKIHSDIIALIP